MVKYWALRLVAVVLGRLPQGLGYALAEIAARIAWLLNRRSRAVIVGNLRQVLGPTVSGREIALIAKQSFRHSARSYFDLVHLPHLRFSALSRRLHYQDWERLEEAYQAGKGVIAVTAHLGATDLLAQVAAVRGLTMTVLTEPMEPPQMLELVTRLRASQGVRYLPATYSGVKEVILALKRGEMVTLACDRPIQGRGQTVPFLDRATLLPTGAVDLALRTGAAVVPLFSLRLPGRRFLLVVEPPLSLERQPTEEATVRAGLQQIIRVMETYIRRYPEQWMVFSPVWPKEGDAPAYSLNPVGSRR